jgi:hypothetical protein
MVSCTSRTTSSSAYFHSTLACVGTGGILSPWRGGPARHLTENGGNHSSRTPVAPASGTRRISWVAAWRPSTTTCRSPSAFRLLPLGRPRGDHPFPHVGGLAAKVMCQDSPMAYQRQNSIDAHVARTRQGVKDRGCSNAPKSKVVDCPRPWRRRPAFRKVDRPVRVDSVEKLLFRSHSKNSRPAEASLLLGCGGPPNVCCVRPRAF